MFTHEFQYNDTLISIRSANPRRDSFNKALIMRKLSSIYGDVSVDLNAAMDIARAAVGETGDVDKERAELLAIAKIYSDPVLESAFEIQNNIRGFADLAIRVVELHDDNLKWITANDDAKVIDAAFQHYLDNAEIWDAIKSQVELMDQPNGKAGAAPDQLDEGDLKSPLHDKSGLNGSKS